MGCINSLLLQLTVEIIDNGTVDTIDHVRSSVGHINITVCDRNDHIPRFTDRVNLVCNKLTTVVIFTYIGTSDMHQ